MCGRYTLSTPGEVISELFGVEPPEGLSPRYNIAPTQESPVIRVEDPDQGRVCDFLRWGLVPFWADDPSIGNRMINARAETAAKKPAFRASFKKRRCLVLADGFYEWKKEGGVKVPYWIHLPERKPFAFAGLWSRWDKDPEALEGEGPLETFTILTTEAHSRIQDLHDRMPVILRREDFDPWLDPEMDDKERLTGMLGNDSGRYLEFHAVSRRVNSPQNDVPENIEPVE